MHVWTKDLDSGKETPLSPAPADKQWPVISRDGSSIAFTVYEKPNWPIYVAATAGGFTERVCKNCGRPDDWSPDGRKLLYLYGTPPHKSIGLLNTVGGENQVDLLKHPNYENKPRSPHFSWDNLWITFYILDGLRGSSQQSSHGRAGFLSQTNCHRPISQWSGAGRKGMDCRNGRLDPRCGATLVARWQHPLLPLRTRPVPMHLGSEIGSSYEAPCFFQPFRYITSTVRSCLAGTRTRALQDWLLPRTRSF